LLDLTVPPTLLAIADEIIDCWEEPEIAALQLFPGPMRRFTAAQQDVCNGAQTGQSTDEARTAAFDLVDGARFRHRGVP
jgi:hypothetical protein